MKTTKRKRPSSQSTRRRLDRPPHKRSLLDQERLRRLSRKSQLTMMTIFSSIKEELSQKVVVLKEGQQLHQRKIRNSSIGEARELVHRLARSLLLLHVKLHPSPEGLPGSQKSSSQNNSLVLNPGRKKRIRIRIPNSNILSLVAQAQRATRGSNSILSLGAQRTRRGSSSILSLGAQVQRTKRGSTSTSITSLQAQAQETTRGSTTTHNRSSSSSEGRGVVVVGRDSSPRPPHPPPKLRSQLTSKLTRKP